jgi:hypothetical protein
MVLISNLKEIKWVIQKRGNMIYLLPFQPRVLLFQTSHLAFKLTCVGLNFIKGKFPKEKIGSAIQSNISTGAEVK